MGGTRLTVDVPKLFELWNSGASQHDISLALGIRPGTFWQVRRRYALPNRKPAKPARASHEPDPTPEELAERCAAVRSNWSAEETERRRVGRASGPVRLRSYSFDRRGFAFSGVDY